VLYALVIAPYVGQLAPPAPATAADPVRAAHVFAQAAFFASVGMLLSAFIAAVAGRIGGLQSEHMHSRTRLES